MQEIAKQRNANKIDEPAARHKPEYSGRLPNFKTLSVIKNTI